MTSCEQCVPLPECPSVMQIMLQNNGAFKTKGANRVNCGFVDMETEAINIGWKLFITSGKISGFLTLYTGRYNCYH
jgi:hypothetical protein